MEGGVWVWVSAVGSVPVDMRREERERSRRKRKEEQLTLLPENSWIVNQNSKERDILSGTFQSHFIDGYLLNSRHPLCLLAVALAVWLALEILESSRSLTPAPTGNNRAGRWQQPWASWF